MVPWQVLTPQGIVDNRVISMKEYSNLHWISEPDPHHQIILMTLFVKGGVFNILQINMIKILKNMS